MVVGGVCHGIDEERGYVAVDHVQTHSADAAAH
jgi:hypothetical protein